MSHIEKRKEEISKLLKGNEKLVSVGYGKKNVNNTKTNDNCIVFRVEKKLPISEINPDELIPKKIEIDGIEYLTDVVESPRFSTHVCDNTTETQCISRVNTYTNRWDPTLIPNRLTQRPLTGGSSMTKTTSLGSGVGTFGFIAVDSETQSLVGVTNNHVAAKIGFITEDFPSYGNIYYNTSIEQVYQTGEPNATITENENIGRVKNYYPLVFGGANPIDAAVIALREEVINNSESFKQTSLPFLEPFPFATTEELDNIIDNDTLQIAAAGRSTGVKYSGECPIEILEVDQSLRIDGYGWFASGYVVDNLLFTDCITYERSNPDCPYPSYGGDSGSAVLGYINNQWKIIGLNFAGGTYIGVFCRIDNVANLLGIESWDGTPKNFLDLDNPEYYYIQGFSNENHVTINEKKYWQIGLVNN